MSSTNTSNASADSQLQSDCLRTLSAHVPSLVVEALEGLKNPLSQNICPVRLRSIMIVVETSIISTTSDAALWKAWWLYIWVFLMRKRSKKELKAIVNKLKSCNCPTDDPNYAESHADINHDKVGARGGTDFWYFPGFLFHVMTEAMENVRLRAVTKGTAGFWPTSLSDLTIVGGADQIARSLDQWHEILCISGYSPAIAFVPCILRLCNKTIYQSFVATNLINTTILIPLSVHLHGFCIALEAAGDPKLVTPPASTLTESCLMNAILCLEHITLPPISSNFNLLDGWEYDAIQLCSLALYLLPHFKLEVSAKTLEQYTLRLSTIGYILFNCFAIHNTVHRNMLLHPKIVERDAVVRPVMQAVLSNHEDVIALAMVACREFRQCGTHNCDLTFTDRGSGFQVCSGCITVGYCDSDCAKKDWKDPNLPHKRLCKMFAKIVEERGGWAFSMCKPEGYYRSFELTKRMSSAIKLLAQENVLSKDDLEFAGAWAGRVLWSLCPKQTTTPPVGGSLGQPHYTSKISSLARNPLFNCPKPQIMNWNKPLPSLTIGPTTGQDLRDTSVIFAFLFTGFKFDPES